MEQDSHIYDEVVVPKSPPTLNKEYAEDCTPQDEHGLPFNIVHRLQGTARISLSNNDAYVPGSPPVSATSPQLQGETEETSEQEDEHIFGPNTDGFDTTVVERQHEIQTIINHHKYARYAALFDTCATRDEVLLSTDEHIVQEITETQHCHDAIQLVNNSEKEVINSHESDAGPEFQANNITECPPSHPIPEQYEDCSEDERKLFGKRIPKITVRVVQSVINKFSIYLAEASRTFSDTQIEILKNYLLCDKRRPELLEKSIYKMREKNFRTESIASSQMGTTIGINPF